MVGPSSWVPPCHSHRPAGKSRWNHCWRSERVGCHSAPGFTTKKRRGNGKNLRNLGKITENPCKRLLVHHPFILTIYVIYLSFYIYIYTTTRWFNLYSTLKKQQQIAILWCSPASSTPAVVSGSCSGVTAATSSTSGIRSLSVFLTRGDMICTSPNLSANPHTYTNTVIIKK